MQTTYHYSPGIIQRMQQALSIKMDRGGREKHNPINDSDIHHENKVRGIKTSNTEVKICKCRGGI